MEHTVDTGQLKTGTLGIAHQGRQLVDEIIIGIIRCDALEMQTVRIPEEQADMAVLTATESQHRGTVHRHVVKAVDLPQRALRQEFARRAFVGRMHVVEFPAVNGADGVHIVDGLRRIPLGLAQHRPEHRIGARVGMALIDPLRQLHDEER